MEAKKVHPDLREMRSKFGVLVDPSFSYEENCAYVFFDVKPGEAPPNELLEAEHARWALFFFSPKGKKPPKPMMGRLCFDRIVLQGHRFRYRFIPANHGQLNTTLCALKSDGRMFYNVEHITLSLPYGGTPFRTGFPMSNSISAYKRREKEREARSSEQKVEEGGRVYFISEYVKDLARHAVSSLCRVDRAEDGSAVVCLTPREDFLWKRFDKRRVCLYVAYRASRFPPTPVEGVLEYLSGASTSSEACYRFIPDQPPDIQTFVEFQLSPPNGGRSYTSNVSSVVIFWRGEVPVQFMNLLQHFGHKKV